MNLREKIIETMIVPSKNLNEEDKMLIKALKRDDCAMCGHPLRRSKRIATIADQILQLILANLPEEQEEVADNLTYGDTKFNSNAVRYGYNEAIRDLKALLGKEN